MKVLLQQARHGCVIAVAVVLGLTARITHAAEPVDFYAGKTIQLIIGYTVGGGYDIYARTLARYMGKHIPGNPTIVPQNMPGAGSLRAVNYLVRAAPKDGTVFGTFARGAVMEQLLDPQAAPFDPQSLKWIGSITNEVSVCAFWHTSGIRTWADMQQKPYVIGGTGAGADTDVFPRVIGHFFHLPLKLVTGFPGGQDVVLSLQRGEINGRCGWSWTSLISRNRTLYDNADIVVPVQLGLRKHPDLPNVPLIMDLSTDSKVKAALKVVFSRQAMSRPFAVPSGIPAERLAILRDAFDATMKDPAFLEEAAKLELEVAPVTGVAIEQLIQEIYATPADIVQLARDALQDTAKP